MLTLFLSVESPPPMVKLYAHLQGLWHGPMLPALHDIICPREGATGWSRLSHRCWGWGCHAVVRRCCHAVMCVEWEEQLQGDVAVVVVVCRPAWPTGQTNMLRPPRSKGGPMSPRQTLRLPPAVKSRASVHAFLANCYQRCHPAYLPSHCRSRMIKAVKVDTLLPMNMSACRPK